MRKGGQRERTRRTENGEESAEKREREREKMVKGDRRRGNGEEKERIFLVVRWSGLCCFGIKLLCVAFDVDGMAEGAGAHAARTFADKKERRAIAWALLWQSLADMEEDAPVPWIQQNIVEVIQSTSDFWVLKDIVHFLRAPSSKPLLLSLQPRKVGKAGSSCYKSANSNGRLQEESE